MHVEFNMKHGVIALDRIDKYSPLNQKLIYSATFLNCHKDLSASKIDVPKCLYIYTYILVSLVRLL